MLKAEPAMNIPVPDIHIVERARPPVCRVRDGS